MAHSSDPSVLALHGLRLKGFAETTAIAEMFAMTEEDVTAQLEAAQEEGFSKLHEGRMVRWGLTPEGRVENEKRLAAELEAAGGREVVNAAYQAFLGPNADMLAVCTAWQVKDLEANELNDHTDAEYDAKVIAELVRIDGIIQPILSDVLAVLERFSLYPDRLQSALEKVQAGETDWFTSPILESYHTVWFEMHEDFLATLGIDRASEGSH